MKKINNSRVLAENELTIVPYKLLSRERWKSILKIGGTIFFFILIAEESHYFLRYGIYGIISLILIFVAIKIVTNWQGYMSGVRSVETTIFGKPLEKKFWKDGEWERTKLKIRLRKK